MTPYELLKKREKERMGGGVETSLSPYEALVKRNEQAQQAQQKKEYEASPAYKRSSFLNTSLGQIQGADKKLNLGSSGVYQAPDSYKPTQEALTSTIMQAQNQLFKDRGEGRTDSKDMQAIRESGIEYMRALNQHQDYYKSFTDKSDYLKKTAPPLEDLFGAKGAKPGAPVQQKVNPYQPKPMMQPDMGQMRKDGVDVMNTHPAYLPQQAQSYQANNQPLPDFKNQYGIVNPYVNKLKELESFKIGQHDTEAVRFAKYAGHYEKMTAIDRLGFELHSFDQEEKQLDKDLQKNEDALTALYATSYENNGATWEQDQIDSNRLHQEATSIQQRKDVIGAMRSEANTVKKMVEVKQKYEPYAVAKDFDDRNKYDEVKIGNLKGTSDKQRALAGIYKQLNGHEADDRGFFDTVSAAFNYKETESFQQTGLDKMTAEEINTFNYLYNTNPEKAQDYLVDMEPELLMRRAIDRQKTLGKAFQGDGKEYLGLALTFGMNLYKAALAPAQIISGLIGADTNSAIWDVNKDVSQLRSSAQKKVQQLFKGAEVPILGGSVADLVFGIGTSLGDMAAGIGFGNFVMGVSGLSLAVMGSRVASDTMLEAQQRGLEPWKAAVTGVAAGAIEILTEKFSLDALFSPVNSKPWRYLLTNMFTEGAEEATAAIANRIVDGIVNADKSEIRQRAVELARSSGMGMEEATKQARMEWLRETGTEFLSGAITGGLAGAGGLAVDHVRNVSTGREINRKGVMTELETFVKTEAGTNSEARVLVNELKTNPSIRQQGQLARTMLNELQVQMQSADTYEAKIAIAEKSQTLIDLIAGLKDVTKITAPAKVAPLSPEIQEQAAPEVVIPQQEGIMPDLSQEEAMERMDERDAQTPSEQYLKLAEEYGYARMGEGAIERVIGKDNMTPEVKEAVQRGQAIRKQETLALEADIKARGAIADTTAKVRTITEAEATASGVERVTAADGKNKTVKAAMNALKTLAEATGVNVVMFKSPLNTKAQHIGKQGWYDSKTRTMYLDVNAGYGNARAIMRAASHELTHFIKNEAPEYFAKYQENIMRMVDEAKGEGTFQGLVESARQLAEENGKKLTIDKATEEALADSSEMMLNGDEATIGKIIEDNPRLFVKVMNWINKFVDSIRTAFIGVSADSEGAKILQETMTTFAEAQGHWFNALEQASVNTRGEVRAEMQMLEAQEKPAKKAPKPKPVVKATESQLAEDKAAGYVEPPLPGQVGFDEAPVAETATTETKTDFTDKFMGAINQDAVKNAPPELLDIINSMKLEGKKPVKPAQINLTPAEVTKAERAKLAHLPIGLRNGIIKWAHNEWINTDLLDGNLRGSEFIKFAERWYNHGMRNKTPKLLPPIALDADFPPFLETTFENLGREDTIAADKRTAKQEAKQAEKDAIQIQPYSGKIEAEQEADKPVAETSVQTKQTPSEQIAETISADFLESGTAFTSKQLFDIADKAFGGTQAQGTYSVKDAYDALELSVNKHLLNVAKTWNGDAQTAQKVSNKIADLLQIIPTQTKRTAEMEAYQQFSTPPNIAYLAAWVANITNNDFMLEPSAGIGGLAVFAKAWGAEVAVNELSERRLEVLRSMGFDHYFNENGEQLDNILPENIKPTVVVMNPPFSATAGRTATNQTKNAIPHIQQALDRLQPGGRLVAIVGQGMNNESPTFKSWWNELRKDYDIRANLSIDGKNYTKYGTAFGVQMVVIDKTGAQTGTTLTGEYTDLSTIPTMLEGIRNDRISQPAKVQQGADIAGSQKTNISAKPEQVISGSIIGTDDVISGNQRSGNEAVTGAAIVDGVDIRTEKQASNAIQTNDGTDGGIVPASREGGPASEVTTDNQGAGQREQSDSTDGTVRDDSGQPGTQRVRPVTQPTRSELKKPKAKKTDNGVFASYEVPTMRTHSGEHPGILVESSAMATVQMPESTYETKLGKEVLRNLSDPQMVAINYAGQAFEKKLVSGERRGFFIGDGTGVGKGREIAGIIADNFAHGGKKAVWFSENPKLFSDAQRDWSATTERSEDEVYYHGKSKAGEDINFDEGVLYSTYGLLSSKTKSARRIDDIVRWLGKDFDGVIAFDEAHNMGNLLGKRGTRGQAKGSQRAKFGVELQSMLPNARMLYITATAATDVDNLAFAQRLGLWGDGTAFIDVQSFIDEIGSAGLSAMELVSRDMKESGSYVARSLTFDGIEYETLTTDLDEVQTEVLDTMSRAWQVVMKNMYASLEATGADKSSNARKNAKGALYSAQQRFYNSVLTALGTPGVIADMRKQLADNKSIVLQIVNTNEAEQERQLGKMEESGASLDELDLTPRGTLLDYMMTNFPVNQYETYVDENGKEQSRQVLDSNGAPVQNKQAVRQRDAMIAEIEAMTIPQGALEMLFDAFGTENVAEVTGRSRRVVPSKNKNGQVEYITESRTPKSTAADTAAFQEGKKRILIFSKAGGTGKSYHADNTEKNQQQRVHYVLQAGWSAIHAVQGFGRTNRTNQANAPIYKLVTTNVKGQKRFISTIAKRLDQLGAMTKGQRDAGSGLFNSADNLESTISRDALRETYWRLGKNKIDGLNGQDIFGKLGLESDFYNEYGQFKVNENKARETNTFLNRVLVLEIEQQNLLFDEFERVNEKMYEDAKAAGTLDEGMEMLKSDKIDIVDNSVIKENPGKGPTRYIQANVSNKPTVLKTVADAKAYRNGFESIGQLADGSTRAMYRIADKTQEWGETTKQYRLYSPNVSGKFSTFQEKTLLDRVTVLPESQWAAAWADGVAKVPEYNTETIHMITGSLLSVWDAMPKEGNTRAIKLVPSDGSESFLGRVIKDDQIDGFLHQMNVARTIKEYSAKEVMDTVLKDDKQVRLTNYRLKIIRRMVNNENRIELTGDNLGILIRRYPAMFMEKISYQSRYFVPNSAEGEAALDELIATNPVMGVSDSANDTDYDYSFRRIGEEDFNSMSERDPARLADRRLLADALENVAESVVDKELLTKYKAGIDAIEIDATRLNEINADIKERSFAKGPRDMVELNRLKNSKEALLNKITRADGALLKLEKAQALKDVVTAEKRTLEKKLKTQAETRIETYREKYQQKVLQERAKGKERLGKYKTSQRAIDSRANIIKLANEINSDVTNPSNQKSVPQVVRGAVGAFIETINQQSKSSLKTNEHQRITKADRAFYDKLQKLRNVLDGINTYQQGEEGVKNEYKALEGFVDMPDNFQSTLASLSDGIFNMMSENADDYVLNKMSAEQLESLEKFLKQLKKSLRNMNKYLANAVFEKVSESGKADIIEFQDVKSRLHRTGKIDKFMNWDNILPAFAFDRLGKGGRSIFQGYQRGMSKMALNGVGMVKFANETFTGKESTAWTTDLHTYQVGENEVSMTSAHLMSLYALNKREQAKGHLYGEGIRVKAFEHKGKTVAHLGTTLTANDVLTMTKDLTPRQIAVADALQEYMNTVGSNWGNQVSMARFGVNMFEELFYFPIQSDSKHLQADGSPSKGNPLYKLLNLGMTKQLTEGANNRIMLDNIFDVFSNHMSDMLQYNSMALPILDSIKWLNYSESYKEADTGIKHTMSMLDALDGAFGESASKYVIGLIRDINGSQMVGSGEQYAQTMLRNFNRSAVAANLRVSLLQPISIVRALNILDPGSLAKGALGNLALIKQNIHQMETWAGIAAWKQLGFYDVNLSRSLQDMIKRDDSRLQKLGEFSMALPQMMDRITWAAIWGASKSKVNKNLNGLVNGSDAYFEKVRDTFDEVIYKSQVVDSMLTRSDYMRKPAFVPKWTSSFMSEPTMTYNMLADQVHSFNDDVAKGMTKGQAWGKNGGQIVRTIGVYAAAKLVETLVEALAQAWRDDDDFLTFMEKLDKAFKGNLLDNLMPLKLPLINDLWEYGKRIVAKAFDVDVWGFKKNTPLTAFADYLEEGVGILAKLYKGEKTSYTLYGGTYKLLQGVSMLSGQPIAGFSREVNDLWNNTVGTAHPDMKIKKYEGGETAAFASLFGAIVDGDKEKEQRLRDILMNEKGVEPKAVYGGIRDNTRDAFKAGKLTFEQAVNMLIAEDGAPENKHNAYWLVKNWETGKNQYDDFNESLTTGKGLKAAVKELTGHGVREETIKTYITNNYKDEYIKLYKTNRAAASNLKARLLTAYVLVGDDRDKRSSLIDKWLIPPKK